MTLSEAIEIISSEIASVLNDTLSSMYLYGSAAVGDFRLGWSDIDILVLTNKEMTEQQAERLLLLRQFLAEKYEDCTFFRAFEGAIVAEDVFFLGKTGKVVYWGTSGQRCADSYRLSSFSLLELLESGILLRGKDVRGRIQRPSYAQLCEETRQHMQAARKHGDSVGWMLDLCRGLYTVCTGMVTSKTRAGEWALQEEVCPDVEVLQRAVMIRKDPLKHSKEDWIVDNAIIQRFADVLERNLPNR